ncbi:inter-alpha-trypsin inhibitor heavy chain H3-like isoform X2 [Bacillus rossius redtenbacheri]|uniref:inter-alpha-trypsin inhibitor heavy chain H3-like isoform X2 n=1 Tax=Bacillus rossius redtenbacheri TaxID=93214 RepID=UPI002FDC89A4
MTKGCRLRGPLTARGYANPWEQWSWQEGKQVAEALGRAVTWQVAAGYKSGAARAGRSAANMIAVCACLSALLVAAVAQQSLVTTTPLADAAPSTPLPADNQTDRPDVYSLHVTSHIQFRYASTIVSSRVANVAAAAREVVFSVVLPETAFISGFLMQIDDKVYKAHVKEKKAAKKEYDEAVKEGQTAGHVAQSARNSNRFTVSVNIESQKKVTFNLTYEELLKRELSVYNHVINIDPGQIVHDMAVEVNINESANITTLEVTNLKDSNEIEFEKSSNNPLAQIARPSGSSATVRWAPSEDQQRGLSAEGVKGQLAVRYDVDRASHPEQILVNEGYFVHFFAPSDLPALSKHVTFLMDVSGSMAGRKIEQLREAMKAILADLRQGDFFSLVVFSTDVQVWDPEHELVVPQSWNSWSPQLNQSESAASEAAVVPATPQNIEKAQRFVKQLQSYYSTNIHGALLKGLELAQLGKKLTSDYDNKPEPIIIFLTDGEANVGESDPDKIVGIVTDKNGADSVAIFALAFGDYANSQFLRKLSLRNSGFARKIYEASDSALQLQDFYRAVSSPLLARVSFVYPEAQVEEGSLSQTNFSALFRGSELVVVGKLQSGELSGHVTARTANGTATVAFEPATSAPFPAWELAVQQRPERNYSQASFMERLWAYLSVQQLLEQQAAETQGNDTSASEQRALDLALKYGFVTPLTSLVVVKPNETISTETEKGDVPGQGYGSNFIAPQAALSGVADRFSLVGGFARPVSLASFPGVPAPSAPFAPAFPLSTRAPDSTMPPRAPDSTTPPLARVIPAQDLAWLAGISNSTHVLLKPDSLGEAKALELGLNKTDEVFSPCSSPLGEGHCRYLPHCALDVFENSVDQFYPFLCIIDTYAGVCCPNYVKPVLVAV